MKTAKLSAFFFILFFMIVGVAYGAEDLQFAQLSDFHLENGQTIKDCRIGYRTLGTLNADKSNVVLFPTWFQGTTQDLIDTGMIGVGKLVDTSQFYVIAVDNIGDGVSSSASNSKAQHGRVFPLFSMRDMVNAQYLLLTRELHLSKIKAVIGVSMGGMQAFQWIVSYQEFMEKAVSIQGDPRPTSSDLLLWQSELMAIEADHNCGDTGRGMRLVAAIHRLNLFTPAYISAHTTPEEFPEYFAGIQKAIEHFSPYDWAFQLMAIRDHDIYRDFGDSPEKAASAVRAKTLVIVSKQDHMVNPEPSRVFAGLINAKLLEFDSDCGHALFLCETEKLHEAVMHFLRE